MQKTKIEDIPWPVYWPSFVLTAPWDAVAIPPIRHRKMQNMTLSRIDIFLGLMERMDDCLDSTLMLERSVVFDSFL